MSAAAAAAVDTIDVLRAVIEPAFSTAMAIAAFAIITAVAILTAVTKTVIVPFLPRQL